MHAIPFITRLSFEGMAFALVLPWFWMLVGLALAAAWWARRHALTPSAYPSQWLSLLLPFAFPVAIILWGSALVASLKGKRSGWHWQEIGIFVLLGLQALSVVVLLTRRRARIGPLLAASLMAIWWAVGASLVAGMAVYNDWI